MGSHDLFRKRREDRKKRRYEYKTPKANSFLIVTEGERTEPLYFKGMQKLIVDKIGGMVQVVEVPLIDVHGEGSSTGKLISKTEKIVKNSKVIYQNIWVVFDRDDFEDFDQAIRDGKDKGYHIAWSNPSFEYWLYLHFFYSDAALHRHDWSEKLNDIFRQYNLADGVYRKNQQDIYCLADLNDGVNIAIKNAKRRMADFDERRDKPSEYDPGTTVYKLAEVLKSYLEE